MKTQTDAYPHWLYDSLNCLQFFLQIDSDYK